ncbi:NAD(P)-dependent oxidoreductase [Streptomyces sp. NP-1717]|uniref:NAD-dependent epimerase/dehydratase family protein n=1 Tax=unclassified Streptomyces TaxID=2593676 RepID=UPI001F5C43EF|nr:NAD(P)-dependent oxidoreductase [Streptomyces sp. NP-1717]MCI3222959.1 NAD(P)-dependent oxidoreductase [Streptomyces sp. NP-1717]WTA71936.1 NAD(P)-dependent oxidoreductase [Streptomyces sp. NBC_00838]
MRVLVTGAAGHIGGHVIDDLLAHGHRIVATDLVPVDDPRLDRVHTGDLSDPGLVRDAMAGADAVVHLGAIPHPNSDDDSALFATNCLTAHRVLDEAGRTGVRRVVAASSLAAVGLAWSPRPQSPRYVPLDEEHPTLVQDPYGLSKVVLEETARATHRRHGTDIVCMRFPFTGTGERLARQLAAVRDDPAAHRTDLWGWLDTRDAARAVRYALHAELTGCHVLNVAAEDTSSPLPTARLLDEHHPGVPYFAELTGHASLFDTTACARLLGFAPKHRRNALDADAGAGAPAGDG